MDCRHDRVVFNCRTIDFQGLTDRQTLLVFIVCVRVCVRVFLGLFSGSATRTVAMFRKKYVTLT